LFLFALETCEKKCCSRKKKDEATERSLSFMAVCGASQMLVVFIVLRPNEK
jgi:transposase